MSAINFSAPAAALVEAAAKTAERLNQALQSDVAHYGNMGTTDAYARLGHSGAFTSMATDIGDAVRLVHEDASYDNDPFQAIMTSKLVPAIEGLTKIGPDIDFSVDGGVGGKVRGMFDTLAELRDGAAAIADGLRASVTERV